MGQNIVVTGATSGLGLALVERLLASGFQPVLTGRNGDKVARAAADLGVPGYQMDVADAGSIQRVSAQIIADLGPIDGLINNAGIWLEGDFDTYSAEQIQRVIDTNTTGTILTTHAFLPEMLNRRSGTIINTVSTGALYCRKLISVYSASKWAIRGFTGCMEVECAPKGVRVMGFYPGKIATSMYDTAGVTRELDVAMSSQQGADMVVTMLQDKGMVWSQVTGRAITDYI
ncbi:SDR family oxidoreductase [Parasedimentitalea marina]|uniref:SDR family oxidoreductase n=1 Tax=Parasedimentitalea marina TaxID=2483033 RepID=A0A3T0N4Y4_9RHOB|nr:SDR family oxidoreductase [Parasedimentitalea marina]AZV79041.1 SDR family oxidoreductase [Parasedimentitalea marina]